MYKTQIAKIERLDKGSINNSDPVEINFHKDSSFDTPPNTHFYLTLASESTPVLKSKNIDSSVFSLSSSILIPMYKTTPKSQYEVFEGISCTILLSPFDSKQISSEPNPEPCQKPFTVLKASLCSDCEAKKNSNFKDFSQVADMVNKELKHSVIRFKKLLEIEKNTKEALLKEIQKHHFELSREREENKKREKSILHDLQLSESTNSELKFELLKIKTENKALAANNKQLLKTVEDENLENQKNLQVYRNKLQIFESESLNLNALLLKIDELTASSNKNISSKTLETENIIKDLKKEISELKLLNKSILLTKKVNETDEIDDLLQNYIKKLKLSGIFSKVKEQTYTYNNKKLILLVKDGLLLCRVNNNLKSFEEYVLNIKPERSISPVFSKSFDGKLTKVSKNTSIRKNLRSGV